MSTPTGLTAKEAFDELDNNRQNYRTPDQLRALADRVSVYSPGETTVLYGGSSGFFNRLLMSV